MMYETYKGYEIWVSWNDETFGFDFSVRDENGEEIASSEASYFYDSNALKAAKEAVDNKLTGFRQEQPGETEDGLV